METTQQTLEQALADLDRIAPGAPLLALGQTVFWDEPMKAGVAMLANRPFIAGVHDTDYFAKLPLAFRTRRDPSPFVMVPHNDTSTKNLWSAAAEFSALFGSETVVTREKLQKYGLRLEKLVAGRPGLLDEATEAWGWRGVVSTSEDPPITAEVSLETVYGALRSALEWAVGETLRCISEPDRLLAAERVERLMALLDEKRHESSNLADFYMRLLPEMYAFVASSAVPIEPTRTTHLLQFNTATAHLDRFALVDAFLNPQTADKARAAYDDAVRGSEMYTLDRFMSGAIPFDLVVPGHGRGTIRIANRAVIVMTPHPLFISLRKPVRSVRDLAEAVEGKFGTNCTLIGKAVTLIGMLAREFIFVFHEGASGYVRRSRAFHERLRDAGVNHPCHPILRVRYRAWDALGECHSWLHLPEPLHRPFGAEEICAPSFAARWHEVAAEQAALLEGLGKLRRPIDLIAFLADHVGSSWTCLAKEYRALHDQLVAVESRTLNLKARRRDLYPLLKQARAARVEAERALGQHWREAIWEKSPSPADLDKRSALKAEVERAIHRVSEIQRQIRSLLHDQREVARDPEVLAHHERRRAIEREAELKRLRLIRSGILATEGLKNAGLRPSAWWFPLLCPDGGWFRETVRTAGAYLEPL